MGKASLIAETIALCAGIALGQNRDMTKRTGITQFGAALADPSRSQILCILMEGRAFTNKELSSHLSLSPQTITQHMQVLQSAGLTVQIKSGRCVYHRIVSDDIAELLEHLSVLVPQTSPVIAAPDHLRAARSCYSHLAGELGVSIANSLRADGRIVGDTHWQFSDKGQSWAQSLGLQPAALKPCLDWTERKPHLGGPFAKSLLTWMFDHACIARHPSGRGIEVLDKARLISVNLIEAP